MDYHFLTELYGILITRIIPSMGEEEREAKEYTINSQLIQGNLTERIRKLMMIWINSGEFGY